MIPPSQSKYPTVSLETKISYVRIPVAMEFVPRWYAWPKIAHVPKPDSTARRIASNWS
jgi:hypothetical protein